MEQVVAQFSELDANQLPALVLTLLDAGVTPQRAAGALASLNQACLAAAAALYGAAAQRLLQAVDIRNQLQNPLVRTVLQARLRIDGNLACLWTKASVCETR